MIAGYLSCRSDPMGRWMIADVGRSCRMGTDFLFPYYVPLLPLQIPFPPFYVQLRTDLSKRKPTLEHLSAGQKNR